MTLKTGLSDIRTVSEAVYWDNALVPSPTNPWPLAPKDLVDAGKVDNDSYAVQNHGLEQSGENTMVPELTRISKAPWFLKGPRGIEVGGAGLMRVEAFLRNPIISLFWPVGITDSSDAGYANANRFVDKHGLRGKIGTCLADIFVAWERGYIDDESTLIYFLGQLVQNQKKAKKDKMMRHLGEFLRMPTPDGELRRLVYLFHARGEDNPESEVEWRNTTPYFDEELRGPTEEGFGGPIAMDIIAQHWHWHQCYSWLRLSAP